MDKRTFCQQCHMKCPVIARVTDGRITGISGSSCPKGAHAHEVIRHPDRITRPLRRSAGKGEGRWQTISWEEAYRLMADRFGELRAFYVPGSNFVVNEGNSHEVWEALRKLDFMVAADLFMTPTAELADLVLPAAHWLETDTPLAPWKDMGRHKFNYVMAAPRVVEPAGECRDDRRIILELAEAKGAGSRWRSVAHFNDWRLEELGISFEELRRMPQQMKSFPVSYRKYEGRGFGTPSGKVELASSILGDGGQDPLPFHQEPPESPLSTPRLAEDYPLLTTFRHRAYEHTEYRQIDSLRRYVPVPEIEVSPETAAQCGIGEGDDILLATPHLPHRMRGRARLVPELHPRVVAALFGWWFPEMPGPEHGCFEANVNAIISNGPPYEPVNGNYQARGVLCKIVPA